MKERPMFSTFIFHLRFLSTFHKRDSSLENAKENVEQIIVQTTVVIYLDQYQYENFTLLTLSSYFRTKRPIKLLMYLWMSCV